MEVIRKNFKEVLPQISASIKKADFLVIDSEFTGLIKGKDVSMFDTPREYYHRLLNGSSDFLLIQFGLCSFIWDEEKDHYMNETYNFYLFPRTRHGQEKIFLCQCSSLDFLVAQGFDFNKVIRDGISYMTEPDEAKMREILAERQKSYTKDKDFISVPEENKPFIEEICKKVREFIDENKSDEMEVDRCNAFVRMLLFQELRIRFKDEIMLETKVLENKDRVLKVLRAKNQDDAKMHEAQKMEKEWEEIEDAVGFSKVARMISQSEKLVVGHNMLLDVLHTLNHFFQPLPEDYKTFKEFAHCMFPSLLDTKYMSSLPPFKDKVISSVLPHLLMTLSEPPFELPKVDCVSGRGYSVSSGRLHEAGYDAFVTGLCFLAMWAHVGRMRGETRARVAPAAPALRPFLNKLFLGKTAHQDSPYMNLNGADPAPSRDHVFHLTFPKEWTRNDIGQLFSAFGPVTVQFEDESHALVALARREHARHALRAMLGHNRVILQPYNHYKARQLQSQNQFDQEGERSKQLCAMTNRNPELRIPREIRSPPVMVPGYMYPLIGVQTQMTEMHVMTTPPANMNTMTSPPTHIAARKRTSSGVFQVDDAEPSPKKAEHARAESEGAAKKTKAVTNGKWKVTETSEIKDVKGKKKNIKEKKLKVIDSFDCEVKSTCVTAFKESDSWD